MADEQDTVLYWLRRSKFVEEKLTQVEQQRDEAQKEVRKIGQQLAQAREKITDLEQWKEQALAQLEMAASYVGGLCAFCDRFADNHHPDCRIYRLRAFLAQQSKP